MLIQLPDDVIAKCYQETRPYHFEQVFYSAENDFTGTEKEFVSAGLAYSYQQIDKHTRRCTQ